jgi:hypothetical protein
MLSQQGGFQVSKRGRMGQKGDRRKPEARGNNKAKGNSAMYI